MRELIHYHRAADLTVKPQGLYPFRPMHPSTVDYVRRLVEVDVQEVLDDPGSTCETDDGVRKWWADLQRLCAEQGWDADALIEQEGTAFEIERFREIVA